MALSPELSAADILGTNAVSPSIHHPWLRGKTEDGCRDHRSTRSSGMAFSVLSVPCSATCDGGVSINCLAQACPLCKGLLPLHRALHVANGAHIHTPPYGLCLAWLKRKVYGAARMSAVAWTVWLHGARNPASNRDEISYPKVAHAAHGGVMYAYTCFQG